VLAAALFEHVSAGLRGDDLATLDGDDVHERAQQDGEAGAAFMKNNRPGLSVRSYRVDRDRRHIC